MPLRAKNPLPPVDWATTCMTAIERPQSAAYLLLQVRLGRGLRPGRVAVPIAAATIWRIIRKPRHDNRATPPSTRGHTPQVVLGAMQRRLYCHPNIQASERSSRSDHGECMEPKTPNKPGNLIAALLTTPLCAFDTEDYFELAY